MKQDVLEELIKENYFTDKIFPGYTGVSESIRHNVILDELKKKYDFSLYIYLKKLNISKILKTFSYIVETIFIVKIEASIQVI